MDGVQLPQGYSHFEEARTSEKGPEGYQMVSFNVTSLFTNVQLDETIDVILGRIYS